MPLKTIASNLYTHIHNNASSEVTLGDYCFALTVDQIIVPVLSKQCFKNCNVIHSILSAPIP